MEPRLQRRVQRYGWDKASVFYEDSWKEQLKPAQDMLLKLAGLNPGDRVLETACGTGLVTMRIAEKVGTNGRVVATDLSDSMIQIAAENIKEKNIDNVTFQRMDSENLEFDDEQFEATISSLGMMYVPDPVRSLKEKYRVLKPGGQTAVVIWGERKNCGWADIFPIVDKRVKTDVCPMFFQQGTGNALKFSLQEAGFKDLQIERFSATIYYPNDELAVMAAFAGGPVALAYQKFDEQTKMEAHQEYLDSISPYKNEKGYKIPGEFVAATAVK